MVDRVAVLYVGIEAEDHEGSVIVQSGSRAVEERRAPKVSSFSVLIRHSYADAFQSRDYQITQFQKFFFPEYKNAPRSLDTPDSEPLI